MSTGNLRPGETVAVEEWLLPGWRVDAFYRKFDVWIDRDDSL